MQLAFYKWKKGKTNKDSKDNEAHPKITARDNTIEANQQVKNWLHDQDVENIHVMLLQKNYLPIVYQQAAVIYRGLPG